MGFLPIDSENPKNVQASQFFAKIESPFSSLNFFWKKTLDEKPKASSFFFGQVDE